MSVCADAQAEYAELVRTVFGDNFTNGGGDERMEVDGDAASLRGNVPHSPPEHFDFVNKEFTTLISGFYDLLYKSERKSLDFDPATPAPDGGDGTGTARLHIKQIPKSNITMSEIVKYLYQLSALKEKIKASTYGDLHYMANVLRLVDGLFLLPPIKLPELIAANSSYLSTHDLVVPYPSVFIWLRGDCSVVPDRIVNGQLMKNSVFQSLEYSPPAITPVNLYMKTMIATYAKRYEGLKQDAYVDQFRCLLERNEGNGRVHNTRLVDHLSATWTESDDNLSHIWLFDNMQIQTLHKRIFLFLEMKYREFTKRSEYYARIKCT